MPNPMEGGKTPAQCGTHAGKSTNGGVLCMYVYVPTDGYGEPTWSAGDTAVPLIFALIKRYCYRQLNTKSPTAKARH